MTSADLNAVSDPCEIAAVLRRAAQYAYDSAGECSAAWQDKDAGAPWTMIGKELERAADRIEKKLP